MYRCRSSSIGKWAPRSPAPISSSARPATANCSSRRDRMARSECSFRIRPPPEQLQASADGHLQRCLVHPHPPSRWKHENSLLLIPLLSLRVLKEGEARTLAGVVDRSANVGFFYTRPRLPKPPL